MPVNGRRLAVLALVVTMTIWGSSFVATKLVLDEAAPFNVTVVRFGLGLSVLLPFATGADSVSSSPSNLPSYSSASRASR